MRKKQRRIAGVLLVAAVVASPLAPGGTSAGSQAGDRYQSDRYGYSVAVPDGWRRSHSRLVPMLLDPREILSLGNFAMPVGGGGDCGREPSAAIEAMKRGDALVSIQEVGVFRGLRAHLLRNFPPRAHRLGEALRPAAWLGERRTAGAMRYAKLAFSDRGRAFEALVYIDGPRTSALRRDIGAILRGLHFQPGSWRRFHGGELDADSYRGS